MTGGGFGHGVRGLQLRKSLLGAVIVDQLKETSLICTIRAGLGGSGKQENEYQYQ
jgi:hypothetical protein